MFDKVPEKEVELLKLNVWLEIKSVEKGLALNILKEGFEWNEETWTSFIM